MIPLLVMTGLLLVVSGVVKVRAATRGSLGLPVLSVLEVLAGLALVVASFGAALSPEGGLRLIAGGLGLLLVSSVSQGLRMRGIRRARAESEARRLITHVKYLSGSEGE